MTTLPPEGPGPQDPGGQPTSDPTPPTPPSAPQEAQAPQEPQYQAPPPPPAPPAPPAPGGGGQAPPGAYAQPQGAPAAADPVSNITLNYWLSVFFTWIPALIFFLIEKDKGDRQAYEYHRDNLNFSLLRVIVGLAAIIPYIGWLVGVLGGIVLFVFHIIAAVKATEAFRTGQKPPFMFNIPLIK